MVLFYDDITSPPAPVSKKHKYIRRAIKLVVGIMVLGALSLWVLSTLGGSGNALRLGIQDYLTDTSGYLAEMDTLHDMSFFPTSRLSFQGLAFYQPIKKDEPTPQKKDSFPPQQSMSDFFAAGDMVASVGRVNIAMKFWDMFLSRRRFVDFEVLNLNMDAGFWLPAALTFSSFKVVPDLQNPAIVGVGTYGPHKLETRMGVTQKADDLGKIFYTIATQTPITITLGTLSLDGVLESAGRRGEIFKIKKFNVGQIEVTGTIVLKKSGTKTMLKADLKLGHSHMLADILLAPTDTTGSITMPVLDMNDIGNIQTAYKQVRDVLGLNVAAERVVFGNRDMTIDLSVKKLMRGENEWGMATADMLVKPYSLTIANITGLVNGGALKGDFTIDATGKEPILKTQIHLRGWDYARMQTQVTAQADTHLTLNATGKTFAELDKNLMGEIVTMAGPGELTRDSVLYGGSGLLNTMLPDISGGDKMMVNCMVADFDVKGRHADAKSLFMDLSDLTVVGTGSINLSTFMMDLEFKPQPGVAVNVTGPITAPKINPDRFSGGNKASGLLPDACQGILKKL